MTPFLLKGTLQNEFWGGSRLKELMGLKTELEAISCVTQLDIGDDIFIASGDRTKALLSETLKSNPLRYLGGNFTGENPPFSVRFIDSSERSPIEVSTSDRLWFILDCEEGAEILAGFTKKLTATMLTTSITKKTLSEICRFIGVKKGESYFIPAGTLYALGRGVSVVEISATGGETHLISDYDRTYPDGTKRNIDINGAVGISKNTHAETPEDDAMLFPFGTVRALGSCKGFTAEILDLDGGNAGLYDKDGFSVLCVTDGRAIISYPSGNLSISTGDCVWLPPDTRIIITGKTQIINIHP